MELTRTLLSILIDEKKSMIFLSGPRQAGKSTLAHQWLNTVHSSGGVYLNFDSLKTRRFIEQEWDQMDRDILSGKIKKIVLDEIHKIPRFKNVLKGYYDDYYRYCQFLVTGSARLPLLKRRGDSLAGRYVNYSLFPFSLTEYLQISSFLNTQKTFEGILALCCSLVEPYKLQIKNYEKLGSFPEPLLHGNEKELVKWQINYLDAILQEDALSISNIHDLLRVEDLFNLILERVGSTFSINSAKNILRASFTGTASWLKVLEKLMLTFEISPWAKKAGKVIQKEKKIYPIDWAFISNDKKGARLEALTGRILWNAVCSLTEMGEGLFEIVFLRTYDKREIDFIILKNKKPLLAVEVKSGGNLSKTHYDLCREFGISQLVSVVSDFSYFKRSASITIGWAAFSLAIENGLLLSIKN